MTMFKYFTDPQYAPTLLTLVPLLPLAGFLINAFFGRRMSAKTCGIVASVSIGLAFLLAVALAEHLMAAPSPHARISSHTVSWFSAEIFGKPFTIDFGLLFDRLGMIMALVITGVGTLIHVYSIGYMAHDKGYHKFFAYLNLFCFAMLCLALGDNLVLLFLGWEGVGLCSYLLIGFWYEDMEKASAGKKAFVVNRIGDLGFLIGMFLLAWHFGTLSFYGGDGASGMFDGPATLLAPQHSGLFTIACVFLFVGACGKSAQIPLYTWLPDAMAGPTPVSALIHAATMVTAGVYMVCRMHPVYNLAPDAMQLVAVVGGLTALFAASIGLVQRDIKKVLAYSTVSQLGFMFMAAGLGAYTFAIFHLVTHAFFKALLFLGSGSVIHSLEHGYGHGDPKAQDLRLMGGLWKKMPVTAMTMFIGGMALAGLPLFAGFFSKDEILLAAFEGNSLVWFLGIAAACMTAFYTARLLALTFMGSFRGEIKAWEHCHESPDVMVVPLMVLAVLSALAGFMNVPPNLGHIIGNEDGAAFAQFLDPLFGAGHGAAEHAHEHGAANFNMALSTVIALVMFIAGLKIYRREGALKRAEIIASGGARPVFNMLLNKYWVDELYDRVIVRPIRMAAQLFFIFIDMLLIDTVVVNGTAFALGALSHVLRRIQTGLVTVYLFVFTLGAAALLLYLMCA